MWARCVMIGNPLGDGDDWILVKEAARVFGATPSRIYSYIDAGKLSVNTDRGVKLVRRTEVEALREKVSLRRQIWWESQVDRS